MNRAFPALRGIAILLVILNHAVTLSLAFGRQHLFDKAGMLEKVILIGLKQLGPAAVPIFLLLSGAFLVYAIQNKDLKTSYKIVLSTLKFILIPYVIWSLIFYGMAAILLGESLAPLTIAKNLLVGYPNNFVPLSVFFYMIAPLLLRAIRWQPWLTLGLIALYQLFSAAVINPLVFGVTLPDWTYWLTLPVLRVTIATWAIFFPLGIAYGLHSKAFTHFVQRAWWVLALLALGMYVLTVLNQIGVVNLALTDLLLPVALVLLALLLRRDQIPAAAWFERVGKRAYGLYLINLVVMQPTLWAFNQIAPGFFGFYWTAVVVAFLAALFIPLTVINQLDRLPPRGRAATRYIFG